MSSRTEQRQRGESAGRPSAKSRLGVIGLNVILAATTLLLVCLLTSKGLRTADKRSNVRAAIAEARSLYDGLDRYYELNRAYPSAHVEPRFDPETLEPLQRRGYYKGNLSRFLLFGRIDAYDAPDDQGPDREFWVEMTLEADPSVRLLVVKSDDAPMSGGKWLEGVYMFRDGRLEAL